MKRRIIVTAGILGLLLSLSVPALAEEPGVQPWEAGASNMGMCSAFLGQTDGMFEPNARAEVNHLIQLLGFGFKSPGELYSVRAKQKVNVAPSEECVRRARP